jgi:hypothetical protein
MRTAAFTLFCFVAFGYAANSQRFSLLPQVGFENSKTAISYNDLKSFSPMGVKFSPQASLRLNYTSKQGHGFFVGVASSRSIVSFSFSDPENGMNNFAATADNLQLRLEGGYQFNSKPIALNKSKQSATNTKRTCGAYSRGNCSGRSASPYRCGNKSNKAKQPQLSKNKSSWVRIQPSVGLGFIPSVKTDVIETTKAGQTTYEYRAGNWNTALIAGTGFEFGRKSTRLFTVSINYFKGLGNMGDRTITSEGIAKQTVTTLNSDVSGWNMRVGIPFSLNGKKSAAKSKEKRKSDCQQYKIIYRCRRSI